ncbi:MAG: alpha/beta hydrolase [Myxococcota bacterium]
MSQEQFKESNEDATSVIYASSEDSMLVRKELGIDIDATWFDVNNKTVQPSEFGFPMQKALQTLSKGNNMVYYVSDPNGETSGYNMNRFKHAAQFFVQQANLKKETFNLTGNIYFIVINADHRETLRSHLKAPQFSQKKQKVINRQNNNNNNNEDNKGDEEELDEEMLKALQMSLEEADENNNDDLEEKQQVLQSDEIIIQNRWVEANKKGSQWVDLKTLMHPNVAKAVPDNMALLIGNPNANSDELFVILPGFMMDLSDVKVYMQGVSQWITNNRKASAIFLFQKGHRGDGTNNMDYDSYMKETEAMFRNVLIPFANTAGLNLRVIGHSMGAMIADLVFAILDQEGSLPETAKLALINPAHDLKSLIATGMIAGASMQTSELDQLENKSKIGENFSVSGKPKKLSPEGLKAMATLTQHMQSQNLYQKSVAVISHIKDVVVKGSHAGMRLPKTRGVVQLDCGGNAHMCVGCKRTQEALEAFFDDPDGKTWVLQNPAPKQQEQDCIVM